MSEMEQATCDCASECRRLRKEAEELRNDTKRYRRACWGLLWLLFTVVTIFMGLAAL